MTSKPIVSVVIPTYNSEKTLDGCLRSIVNQTIPCEMIIIDNCSKDRTIEIAKKYPAKFISINLRRSEARNRGIKESMGRFVLSIDSDMELMPKVIEECLVAINIHEKIGGVIIPERSVGDSFWVHVRDFERSFYSGTDIESARFFKISLAVEVGGYDDDVTFFEENTLPLKLEKSGYDVNTRINAEILHNEQFFSLLSWLQKKYLYAKSATVYREKFGKNSFNKTSVLYRISIFLKNRRFYSKPLLASGLVLLKFLECFSSGLGFLMSKIENERHS